MWTGLKINYNAHRHEGTTVKPYGIIPAEVRLSNRLLYISLYADDICE